MRRRNGLEMSMCVVRKLSSSSHYLEACMGSKMRLRAHETRIDNVRFNSVIL